MQYGNVIRTIRAAKGLSQEELGKLIGVDTSYISRLEKGGRTPSLNTLQKIASKLDIPFNLLLLLGSDSSQFENFSQTQMNKLGRVLLDLVINDVQPKAAQAKT